MPKQKPAWKQLLDASQVGINLVIATFIGFFIGYLIDGKFHTSPWFTIIFLLIGIAAGFRELFRYVRRGAEENKNDKKNI